MSAEQLVALEAAIAELGTLYTVARSFTMLHDAAEHELLPRVSALGSHLRARMRGQGISAADVDEAAREIVAVRSHWRTALDNVRVSSTYQETCAAYDNDCQADLARLIPRVFFELLPVQATGSLYFPMSPSSGRRRPGASPFLGAPECADRILEVLREGVVADEGGAEWWERDLPFVACAETAAALDTPISLQLAPSEIKVAVFAVADEPLYRIFTRRLCAPMSVAVAGEAADEWWEAYEESYRAFRDALHAELTARGVTVAAEGEL